MKSVIITSNSLTNFCLETVSENISPLILGMVGNTLKVGLPLLVAPPPLRLKLACSCRTLFELPLFANIVGGGGGAVEAAAVVITIWKS